MVNEGTNGGIRNADCIANCNTVCYSLDRADFQRLLGSMHELISINSKARILKNVQTFNALTNPEREEIARLMKRENYAIGDTIIKQGTLFSIFLIRVALSHICLFVYLFLLPFYLGF